MANYQVVVGNVGTIYDGPEWSVANDKYHTYVELSKDGYGRVAGEPVTFLTDGEIMREYPGTNPGEDE